MEKNKYHFSKMSETIENTIEVTTQSGFSGLLTGFKEFDELTGGLQPSSLVVLASRPSMGKSSLAISMTINIAINQKKPIGFISLEVNSENLINKFISQETNFSAMKLMNGQLSEHEWESLYTTTHNIKEAPIYILDAPRIQINDLVTCCNDLVFEQNVECIVIDYLQLIDPNPSNYNLGNREQEISMIVRVLKQTARELKIPIVLLSQLSRAVESRGGSRRPLLVDLRDSGAIEDHADIVAFIYRPEYYHFEFWPDDDAPPCKGQAELMISKHRNGDLGNIRLSFNSITGKFNNMSEFSFSQNTVINELEDFSSKWNTDDMPF